MLAPCRVAIAGAQIMYKDRALAAEPVNAQVGQRGVSYFTVRGRSKITTLTILKALARNVPGKAATES